MVLLFEIFLSLIRIFLLLSGIFVTFTFGSSLYNAINTYLQAWSAPCLEIISTLVLVVPIVAIFYGTHIQKFFWRRESLYNKKVFLISFAIGIVMAFIPFGVYSSYQTLPEQYCRMPAGLFDKTVYTVATAALTSLLAFIGMDIGVLLKHSSKRISSSHSLPKKKTSKKKSSKKTKQK